MFHNYLTTALRNLIRHKLYSFINIAGLAVGLACAVLIALFVQDEISYDKWIPGSQSLYRIELTYHLPGRPDIVTAQTSMPLPPAMREQIPEVRAETRLASERMTMIVGDRRFSEKVAVVDPNFLEVIKLPLVSGDSRSILAQPESAILSQSAARKYFGDEDPVGKIISTGQAPCSADIPSCVNTNAMVSLRITAVMRDLPHNTQLDADIIVPNTSTVDRVSQKVKQSWLSNAGTYGYLTLDPGVEPSVVLTKLNPILDRSIDPLDFSGTKIPGSKILTVRLTPFQNAHLSTDRFGGMKPGGSWTLIYGISSIGLMILLVASFNFMNLATARASLRAREISLRKCLGASRQQLMVQFLGEAVLISFLALFVSLAIVEMLLPIYSGFLQVPLSFDYLGHGYMLMMMVVVTVFVGVISGFYPALILSGFRPASVLHTNTSSNSGSTALRSTLVILQFSVAIGLGIAAVVVFQQINFAKRMDLGFQRDNITTINTGGRLTASNLESFAHMLERGPGISGVARSSLVAFSGDNDEMQLQKAGDPQVFSPTDIAISPSYFQLYHIKLLSGRSFSDHRGNDFFYYGADAESAGQNENHSVIINEALARVLGYTPVSALNQTLILGKAHVKIIGVVANTLMDGVRSTAAEMVYVYAPSSLQNLSVKLQADHAQEAMAYIQRVWRLFIPNVEQTPNFLDNSYNRLYQSDEKQGEIFGIFVVIAVLIACLGLFGLASFTADRRTKEIGIRKVFGARNRDIVFLMLWQFSLPVITANAIAWPLAWYYLHNWLNHYSYRIQLDPLYFIGAGAVALAIAWATVFSHIRRIANASPIYALHHE